MNSEQKFYFTIIICSGYYQSFYNQHNVNSDAQTEKKQEIQVAERLARVVLFRRVNFTKVCTILFSIKNKKILSNLV